MRVVIARVLARAELAAARPPEKGVRKGVTIVPRRGVRVVQTPPRPLGTLAVDARLGDHQVDRDDQQDADERAHDAFHPALAPVLRGQHREADLAGSGCVDLPLDHRAQLPVGRDEVGPEQRADHDHDRECAAEPEGAQLPLALRDLVEAGRQHHHKGGRGEVLVDRQLQPVHIRQMARGHLHRDREHDRLRERRAEADHHGRDVQEEREVVRGDRERHGREANSGASARLRRA